MTGPLWKGDGAHSEVRDPPRETEGDEVPENRLIILDFGGENKMVAASEHGMPGWISASEADPDPPAIQPGHRRDDDSQEEQRVRERRHSLR
jgi:hypothetical protein